MSDSGAGIDTADLVSFVSERLDVDVVETEVLHDGLNLSVAISTAEGDPAYVLRRPNKLRHTASFNDVKREYEVLGRLEDTAIPTPAPVLVCEDASVVGAPFLVMTYLAGETVPLGADLPERFRNPTAREGVADRLIATLADLHAVDVAPFTGVCDERSPREQIAHVTDRLETATGETGHDPPELRRVLDWLRRNAPDAPATTLVHGDYRPSNVLFAEGTEPRISGVLDWETAFLGDPLTDLGYLLLRWRDDDDPTPSLDALEAGYENEDAIEELREINERGLAPFTNAPGSPSRRELVARYEERTGIAVEDERFYRAFAACTLATVWEDLHREQIAAGGESDREPYIDYMSMLAASIADGEFQL